MLVQCTPRMCPALEPWNIPAKPPRILGALFRGLGAAEGSAVSVGSVSGSESDSSRWMVVTGADSSVWNPCDRVGVILGRRKGMGVVSERCEERARQGEGVER